MTEPFTFTVRNGRHARPGEIRMPRGRDPHAAFMPVGTAAT
jgi:queuine/archaeosine tRNA-ribosyltransferase